MISKHQIKMLKDDGLRSMYRQIFSKTNLARKQVFSQDYKSHLEKAKR